MMKHKTILLSLLAFLAFAGCEDLEETYEDYTGNGPVRYLAKCSDVTVESGWERLVITWKNNLDPNRNGIWLHCESMSTSLDTLLPADCDSCSVNGLAEGTYNITVAAVSEQGDTALTALGNGRPYTPNHEAVLSFTRGLTKYIFVKDKLVLFAGMKTSEIVDFKLDYTGTDGQTKTYNLSDNMWAFMERDLLVEDVDASQPVTLKRRGLIGECPDTITFPDYVLDPDALNMAADFHSRIIERYGEVDLSMEELELDYDLSSMEDILYFQNLKKLVLGKNRFYDPENPYNPKSSVANSDYTMQERTNFCIRTLHQVNPEFSIDNYGGHYNIWFYTFMGDGITVTDHGERNALPDDLQLFATDGFTLTADGEALEDSNLLDQDATTMWESPIAQAQATHDIVLDMGEARAVKGVMVTQARVSTNARNYLPEAVTVYVSTDGVNWTNPCPMEGLTLGMVAGERKLVDFLAEQNVRYIRVTVSDVYYNGNYGSVLGDIIPY